MFWHHRRWYRSFWVRRVFIAPAVFVARPGRVTVVVGTTAFIRINPWYRTVIFEGDEGYVLMSAPVGYETDALPGGAETIDVDGQTYAYAEWSFYQQTAEGGYVVVDAPAGAEVSAIPEEANLHDDEGEEPLYQFDNTYFSQDTNDAGATIYRVEPQPPEEEIDTIPAGSPSFVAADETYHHVNYSFYVEYEENGQSGFVNGEPDIGAPVDELPTEAQEVADNLYQFDTVFFEAVENENGSVFYEVVDSPDGEEVVEVESD
jgi:hypothetical protein